MVAEFLLIRTWQLVDTGIPPPAASTTQCYLMTVCSEPKSTKNRSITSRDLCTNSYEFNQSQSSSCDACDQMNICANKCIYFAFNLKCLQVIYNVIVSSLWTWTWQSVCMCISLAVCQYYSMTMTICLVTQATRIRSITTVQPPKFLPHNVYLLSQKRLLGMIKLKLKFD